MRSGWEGKNRQKRATRKKGYTGKRKRRLKGGLLTVCGSWQILTLALIISNLGICYYGYYQKKGIFAEGFQASTMMYYLTISMSLTAGIRNTFVTAMLDKNNGDRGIPILETAEYRNKILLFYLDEIYKVKTPSIFQILVLSRAGKTFQAFLYYVLIWLEK